MKHILKKHYPRPGLPLQANLILIEIKYLIFQQKFGVTLDSAPRFRFGVPTNQALFPMAGPHALSQLNPDRDKIIGFLVFKNFQGASGATTPAANGFKFGATANTNDPTRIVAYLIF